MLVYPPLIGWDFLGLTLVSVYFDIAKRLLQDVLLL